MPNCPILANSPKTENPTMWDSSAMRPQLTLETFDVSAPILRVAWLETSKANQQCYTTSTATHAPLDFVYGILQLYFNYSTFSSVATKLRGL